MRTENGEESFVDILRELDKNKFARQIADKIEQLQKESAKLNFLLIIGAFTTIIFLNYMNKLSMESNGWIIAGSVNNFAETPNV